MAPPSDINPTAFLGHAITTIVISTEHGEKKYVARRDLLRDKSAYFAAAYRTSMQEATEDRFAIKDVCEAAIRTLIVWLHTGKVYLEPGEAPPLEAPAMEPTGAVDSGRTGQEENAPAEDDDAGFDDGSDRDSSYSGGPSPDIDGYHAMYDGMDGR